jgi:hypothetical protein
MTSTSKMVPDHRDYRWKAIIRYEYYYVWASLYQSKSRILVADSRDLFFQRNPFDTLGRDLETHLLVFDSGPSKDPNFPLNISMPISHSLPDSNWIRNAYNETTFMEIKDKPSLCSGTTIGGQLALTMYARAMMYQHNYTMTLHGHRKNYDQAYHNVLVHKHLLENVTNITNVTKHTSGDPLSPVRTMGQEVKFRYKLKSLAKIDWFHNKSGEELIVNFDGSVTAVVHQGDRHPEIKAMLTRRASKETMKWNTTTAIQMIENLA